MSIFGGGDRKPAAPAKSAVNGGVATMIGVLLASLIVGNNPELEPGREVIIIASAGLLGGIGNIARSATAQGASGVKWAFGQLFGWLG